MRKRGPQKLAWGSPLAGNAARQMGCMGDQDRGPREIADFVGWEDPSASSAGPLGHTAVLLELSLVLLVAFSVGLFLMVRGLLQRPLSAEELAVEQVQGYSGERVVTGWPGRA